LIVFGDKDRAIHPATADILHKLIPNSEVIIMKGLGHLPMIEQPEACADNYLNFRERLDKKKRDFRRTDRNGATARRQNPAFCLTGKILFLIVCSIRHAAEIFQPIFFHG